MTRVKVCAVKRLEDALLVAECGADAVGLLVGQKHVSSDFISPALAREIVQALPPFVAPVLVTHIPEPDDVKRLIDDTGVNTVQIHSEMGPGEVAGIREAFPNVKFFKSYHVTGPESLSYGADFRGIVHGFVLDSIDVAAGRTGGTGKTHSWEVSQEIVKRYPGIPIFLAGGLSCDNVERAIATVRPFGVDVNSGTKAADGFKDPLKVRNFISLAKGVGYFRPEEGDGRQFEQGLPLPPVIAPSPRVPTTPEVG